MITIQEIGLLSSTGELLWKKENLHNMLHNDGEEFIINVLFGGAAVPDFYYFGLDNRSSLNITDTMASVVNEPSVNGYARQKIASGASTDNTSQFTILTESPYTAQSSILFFSANNSGSWGPVSNLFMTNKSDGSGYLISSVPLSTTTTVATGTSIYVRMGFQLSDNSI
jgi:hypothetical protein